MSSSRHYSPLTTDEISNAPVAGLPPRSIPMTDNIKKMSPADAATAVEGIALAFAATAGIEGKLLGVKPDPFATECRGKVPVKWIAAFESVMHGKVFDGPLMVRVNLGTGAASLDHER